MKFSYSLVKKLVPAVKNKKELIEKLNLHSFEAEDVGGDVFEVSVPPNRFSDAASHMGIAREIAAILKIKFQISNPKFQTNSKSEIQNSKIVVNIKNKDLCSRYAAQYFENIKIVSSPKWLQKILIDCGLRPINNVVDIMNYAMLLTGQPLHAFDYDKLTNDQQPTTNNSRKSSVVDRKSIVIRRAEKSEKITTLDNQTFELNENVLVIADEKNPLAIAGIKGGKFAEVDKNTKKIIVEAANFNAVNIYKTSKFLKLSTDASLRFSHNLNPELVPLGLNEAGKLLKEIIGAKAGESVDINFTKSREKVIKLDLERFNKFVGLNLDIKTCRKYLELLGFKINQLPNYPIAHLLAEPPFLRDDIETFEDLSEEIARLYGYGRINPQSPHVRLIPSGFEDLIVLKDKIKKILFGLGLSEVYNYSFIDKADDEVIELENPISSQFKYLRSSLAQHLIKNASSNFRFFNEVEIFEIGKVFRCQVSGVKCQDVLESLKLGIILASKNKKGEMFFELKGIIERLFKKIGLVEYLMPGSDLSRDYLISGEVLDIKSGGEIIGYLGRLNQELIGNKEGALAEIDLEALLKLAIEEREYRPLPKYPSIMRDIYILVNPTVRVGEIMRLIQESDLEYIDDVDLLDEYEYVKVLANRRTRIMRSLTFRIVFQAEDRTLTDKEVNDKMEEIIKILKTKFKAEIR